MNKELFYELCEKYEVELSEEYQTPMIKIDDEVVELLQYIKKDNNLINVKERENYKIILDNSDSK